MTPHFHHSSNIHIFSLQTLDKCHECLPITFANSFDPDQAYKTLGLISIKTFDTLMVFLKGFFVKLDWEKIFEYPLYYPSKVSTAAAQKHFSIISSGSNCFFELMASSGR